MASESTKGIVANAQRVVISVTQSGTTETVVQIGVPDTSADYGVLIPTPSEPTLDPKPISEAALDTLDRVSQPTIVRALPQSEDDGISCGCGVGGDDDSAANSSGPGETVTASQPVNIGPVTAVTLTATDSAALETWLDDNGFAIPDERKDLVASYVGEGRYLIAVKRNDASAPGGPTSIGVHYTLTGDHRLLSLAFARLGAAPTVTFTVFLFAPEMALPSSPFEALSLDDLDAKLLWNKDYAGAVHQAVKAHGGHAFVLEAGGNPPSMANAILPPTIVDRSAAFVRMSTVVDADDLTDDAMFFEPGSGPIQTTRKVYAFGVAMPASVGLVGLVALAWGARRGRRLSRL